MAKHLQNNVAVAEFKAALQLIWLALPEKAIDNTVRDHRKWLQACMSAIGGHFEQSVLFNNDQTSRPRARTRLQSKGRDQGLTSWPSHTQDHCKWYILSSMTLQCETNKHKTHDTQTDLHFQRLKTVVRPVLSIKQQNHHYWLKVVPVCIKAQVHVL